MQDFMIWRGNMGRIICAILIGFSCPFIANGMDFGDSTKASFSVNPRLHTAGYFPFTGALLNHNPVADVNFFYERKALGFFVFQSVDLVDRHSYANYLQPGVFATLRTSEKLRLRGFFGYIFSQTKGFADPESDYYAAGQVNWQIAPSFRVENTLLFYDFSTSEKLANRLLLEYKHSKFRISGYIWQRVVLDENFASTSGSLAITFPIIRVSAKTNIELTSSYMGYLSTAKPDFALRDGVFFTLAVPMDLISPN